MRRSKVTDNIQLISRFISSGEFIGKKQDELVAILEAQEDFQGSQTLLEERMSEMGARLVLLPKFHPEFNPVECNYRYINHSQLFKSFQLTLCPGTSASSAETETLLELHTDF